MISIAIVGTGNVGTHLFKAFYEVKDVEVSIINSRKLDTLPKSDLTIIAVADDAIAEVSSNISNSFVVHTSGSVPMNALQNLTSKGVFYPLQSFSKEKEVNFSGIPFCLEAENSKDLSKLERLVSLLGGKIYHINSEQRKRIHIAAVFANNFTNHMYAMANDICKEHDIPFDILHPLIAETSEKIKTMNPLEAQTGPAIRDDQKTIQNHLHLLNESQKEMYLKLTASIQHYGKKL